MPGKKATELRTAAIPNTESCGKKSDKCSKDRPFSSSKNNKKVYLYILSTHGHKGESSWMSKWDFGNRS